MKMTRPWTIRAPQEAARQREGDRLPDIHIQPPTMLALSRGGTKTGGLEQHLSTGETVIYHVTVTLAQYITFRPSAYILCSVYKPFCGYTLEVGSNPSALISTSIGGVHSRTG